MPGILDFLYKIKHEYNIKLAITTSSWPESFEAKIGSCKDFIKKDFDVIITGDDKRIKKGKPNPDIFSVAIEDLGLKLEERIVFEDSVNGEGLPLLLGLKELFLFLILL